MAGSKGGGTSVQAPPEKGAERDRIVGLLTEIDRLLGAGGEPGRDARFEAEIGRLLEGFDDRLAAVNRRLDRVLERRA